MRDFQDVEKYLRKIHLLILRVAKLLKICTPEPWNASFEKDVLSNLRILYYSVYGLVPVR